MDRKALAILRRLKERVRDPYRATDDSQHPATVYPPASPQLVAMAEKKLGFRLPDLLRDIYMQVGNGGFGPDYGIAGLRGGATFEGEEKSLDEVYGEMCCLKGENPVWKWPKKLLPFCYCGCGMWRCVDGIDAKFRLFIFDPNNLDPDWDGKNALINWGTAFWDEGESLEGWLQRWLDEAPRKDPVRPKSAWIKARLGYRMPEK